MKRSGVGNSVVQYIIIIVLIAVVLVPVFMTLGKTISSQFGGFEFHTDDGSSDASRSFADEIASGLVTSGMFLGTASQPVGKCIGDKCAIDYGDIALNGIPSDFNAFVETSGTSGGVDMLAGSFKQIADQFAKDGNSQASEEFQILADLGYMLADIHEKVEEISKSCVDTPDPGYCFQTGIKNNDVAIVNNIEQDILSKYSATSDFFDKIIDNQIDAARYYKVNYPSTYARMKESTPSFAMLEQFDKIMANPDYSDTVKQTTKELFVTTDSLISNQSVYIMNEFYPPTTEIWYLDPLTGEKTLEMDLGPLIADLGGGDIFDGKISTNIALFNNLVSELEK